MPSATYVPHIDLVLRTLRVNRERLQSKSKIAIDTELLRSILQLAVQTLPFSAAFYAATYPDIAEAHRTGQIPDLRRHFLEQGYFEGRAGAEPRVDDAFYLALYPDVVTAIEAGQVADAADHYRRAGAAEGRVPRPAVQAEVEQWNRLLRDERQQAS